MAVRLSKSERLLDFDYVDPEGNVHFSNREAMEEECVTSLILPRQDWVDFGGPRQITVLVRPGDHLNPPGEIDRRPMF